MRRLKILFVFFILFGLVSCQTDLDIFQAIEKDLVLDLDNNDTLDAVTKDISLPFYGQDIKDLVINWQSSDETHARIEDGKIIITRPTLQDINVTITAQVTYKKEVKNFEFDLVVKKANVVIATHLVTIMMVRIMKYLQSIIIQTLMKTILLKKVIHLVVIIPIKHLKNYG